MGNKDLQCIRHSPLLCVYSFDSPWLGQEKKIEIKALRWLENTVLGLVFASTVLRHVNSGGRGGRHAPPMLGKYYGSWKITHFTWN